MHFKGGIMSEDIGWFLPLPQNILKNYLKLSYPIHDNDKVLVHRIYLIACWKLLQLWNKKIESLLFICVYKRLWKYKILDNGIGKPFCTTCKSKKGKSQKKSKKLRIDVLSMSHTGCTNSI